MGTKLSAKSTRRSRKTRFHSPEMFQRRSTHPFDSSPTSTSFHTGAAQNVQAGTSYAGLPDLPTDILVMICKIIFEENDHTFKLLDAVCCNTILRPRIFAEVAKFEVTLHHLNYNSAKNLNTETLASIQNFTLKFWFMSPSQVVQLFQGKGAFRRVHLIRVESFFQRIWIGRDDSHLGLKILIPTILSQSDHIEELLLTSPSKYSSDSEKLLACIWNLNFHLNVDATIEPKHGETTTTWKWVANKGEKLRWRNAALDWDEKNNRFLSPEELVAKFNPKSLTE